jgi:hypothetical protein
MILWLRLDNRYKDELLALLKLFFKKDRVLGFSYEQKDDEWKLFIHFSRGVVQISGDKKHGIKNTMYVSPIIETIPW